MRATLPPAAALAVSLLLAPPVSTQTVASVERIVTHGNEHPAGAVRRGVLELRLEARHGRWFPEADDGPSVDVYAFGEAGGPLRIPGPMIRVTEGTEIRISLRNRLPEPLVVYGLHARPGSLRDTLQIAAGATREVRFRAGPPGTYFYWGSTTGKSMDERDGIDGQLSGAFIVDPVGARASDRVFVIGIWFDEGKNGAPDREVMTINGRGWPHTERFAFTIGDTVRWRWVNPSASSHPMHLHGFYFRVDSRGTWAADTVYGDTDRRLAVTELMLPGGTNQFVWSPEREGNWLFHCHFPVHMAPAVSLSHGVRAQAGTHVHDGDHAEHAMAGLVLGISVRAAPGTSTPVEDYSNARRLRLLVQSAPRRFGEAPGFGYVLHGGGAEPAADSINIPGPTLVLRRDEPVEITVVNRLQGPTSVHWHGIELESFPDGVPGWSGTPGNILPAIAPADSFVARFTPPRSGTFIYHTHVSEVDHIRGGMFGALLVLEPDQTFDPTTDHVIVVGQAGAGDEPPVTVNGSRSPTAIELRAGDTHRLRLINITGDWRVMFSVLSDTAYARWRPVAKDGADLPVGQASWRPAHLLTGPGETADFEISFPTPGIWRLEVKSQLPGFNLPVLIHVH